jgi:1-acyl-sn-glycerol-3-phosphate acyltransferase
MKVPLPPRWVRRVVIDPVFWVMGLVLFLVTLPVLVVVSVLVLLLPGQLRGLRLLGFALVFLAVEVVVLPVAFISWVVSGFGWAIRRPTFVEFHYQVARVLLVVLYWCGSRFFALEMDRRGPEQPERDPLAFVSPLLVLSRHAGPGDSLLLVHELLSWARRRPRVVLKDTLQWDPMIDVLLNRLPMAFVDAASADQGGVVGEIGRLASSMGPRDALLIFPEGGNVTAKRQKQAIERLRSSGREAAAARAEGIVHLLPPRPRGVQAALLANRDLRVVVVAHTGLDDLNTISDLWKAIPVDKTLHLRWQAVSAIEVPSDEQALSDWLFTEWEAMDVWVSAHRADPVGNAP